MTEGLNLDQLRAGYDQIQARMAELDAQREAVASDLANLNARITNMLLPLAAELKDYETRWTAAWDEVEPVLDRVVQQWRAEEDNTPEHLATMLGFAVADMLAARDTRVATQAAIIRQQSDALMNASGL